MKGLFAITGWDPKRIEGSSGGAPGGQEIEGSLRFPSVPRSSLLMRYAFMC